MEKTRQAFGMVKKTPRAQKWPYLLSVKGGLGAKPCCEPAYNTDCRTMESGRELPYLWNKWPKLGKILPILARPEKPKIGVL